MHANYRAYQLEEQKIQDEKNRLALRRVQADLKESNQALQTMKTEKQRLALQLKQKEQEIQAAYALLRLPQGLERTKAVDLATERQIADLTCRLDQAVALADERKAEIIRLTLNRLEDDREI